MSIADAKRLYEEFHGRKPGKGDIGKIALGSKVFLVIGELDAVLYKVKGERKSFFHRFSKRDRPFLAVSSDGRQIVTLKGAFRFTERGFVK
jgi:hypothetical protein